MLTDSARYTEWPAPESNGTSFEALLDKSLLVTARGCESLALTIGRSQAGQKEVGTQWPCSLQEQPVGRSRRVLDQKSTSPELPPAEREDR